MKQIKSIAHVGHTKTVDDFERIARSFDWLFANGYNVTDDCRSDFIDLNKGRDFLIEDKQYDLVILHFLFRGGFHITRTSGQLAVSPRQSWGAWIQRLKQVNAKVIIAFGGFGEIGGSFIAHLDGYEKIDIIDEMTAFIRIN